MTLGQLIPKYARKPLLITLGINCVVYYGPKLLMPVLHYHKLQTALDPLIPQVPVFIYIYVLAFLQWGLGYIIIARDSRERCYRVLSGEIIAKLIALAIFLLWPTVMDRPALAPGPGAWLLGLIYAVDTPVNLFPSLHCQESWQVFRYSVGLKRMPRWYAWLQLVFTLLVFAAVLLVKQHIWPDVLGGVAVAELGQWLGRRLGAHRVFARLDHETKDETDL